MNSMIACPTCGQTNPAGSLFCAKCHTSFPGVGDSPTIGAASRSLSSFDDTTLAGGTPVPIMERGTKLAGGRYEILEILGQGAMGAVYKAKDHELDRWVAIKVIQPELANSRAILKRFKQELILARQVTHRNVVRIFDIVRRNYILRQFAIQIVIRQKLLVSTQLQQSIHHVIPIFFFNSHFCFS